MPNHTPRSPQQQPQVLRLTLEEWLLPVTVITALLFLFFSQAWFSDLSSLLWFGLLFLWLFAAILGSAFAVVRHAEALGERIGEPLGTLVLTLSVTGLEVIMVAAVMYGGEGAGTLGRDVMFAVVMVVLNGMVGLSLLLGGLRHHEQDYNLRGANAFLAVIVPLSVLGLILPNFTTSVPGPAFSSLHAGFLAVMSSGLYAVFLAIQTFRHREYFVEEEDGSVVLASARSAVAKREHCSPGRSTAYHAALLASYLLPLVVLAKKFAVPIDHAVRTLRAPTALGGLLVAVLILSPESVAGVRAALANQLQRAINLLLGSVLATIGLTVPVVLVIGFVTGQTIVLGLEPANMVLLTLTLGVSALTFAAPRTNVLQGAVHLLLFVAYLMLVLEA